MCQFKDQNDDSGNSKYFDLLPYILLDCRGVLATPIQTLHLHYTVVNVIYQLVLICPAALITTVLPQLVPVLVDMIHEGHYEGYRTAFGHDM